MQAVGLASQAQLASAFASYAPVIIICIFSYHKIGRKGKLEIAPTKLMGTAADLSVAYSPGVAEPCLSIHKDPKWAYEYTAKGHLGTLCFKLLPIPSDSLSSM
jgi:malic enzyme